MSLDLVYSTLLLNYLYLKHKLDKIKFFNKEIIMTDENGEGRINIPCDRIVSTFSNSYVKVICRDNYTIIKTIDLDQQDEIWSEENNVIKHRHIFKPVSTKVIIYYV
ncbi:MAG: hypothetical protein QXS19_05810 [Candidatus Methanomethylicia archaeon]